MRKGNRDLKTLQELPVAKEAGTNDDMSKLTASDLVLKDAVAGISTENDMIVEENGRSKRKRVPKIMYLP